MTVRRLVAIGAIVFLLWHGGALVVASYPNSALSNAPRPLFNSYLRAAYPDNQVVYLGSRPDAGRLLRYQIVNGDGQVDERILAEAVPRSDPAWFHWIRLYDRVTKSWPELRDSTAHFLCSRHTILAPRGIRFVVLHQLTLTHDQYLHGVRPTDPEALRRETLPEIPCA